MMTVGEKRLGSGLLTNGVDVDTLGVSLARPSGKPEARCLLQHAPSQLQAFYQIYAQAGLG